MTPLSHLLAVAERRLAAQDAFGARVFFEEALALSPDHALALRRLATLTLTIDPSAAVVYATRLAQRHPRDEEAQNLLGQAHGALGHAGEALTAFRQAATLAPASASAHCNLALALLRAGDAAAARAAAEQAIALDPRMAEAHANLGHARSALGQPEAAMDDYRAALALVGEHPDALHGIAAAQRMLGNATAAAVALQRATTAAPGWVAAHVELAQVLAELGEFDGALTSARRATALAPDHVGFASNVLFALQYHSTVAAADATAEARAWGQRLCARLAPLPPRPPAAPSARLRVGYVSADLWRHPVGWLGAGAIAAHDKDAVHVTIYANQTRRDALTDALRPKVDRWVEVARLDDTALAKRITDDRIDVLVDLSGHTGGNRLPVFARRAAPVQASWLGYFATTGLPTMDAVLLDDDHVAPGLEALFSERVIRLPMGRFCYGAPDDAPPPRLPNEGTITFASFNNAAKLNPAVIELWAKVVNAVPGSRLLLKWRSFADRVLQQRVAQRFAAAGLDRARLAFEGASEHAAMLDRYGDVDVALDPFPFCGGLTTCEALWMGVPVVTLPGEAVVSRQGHAILRRIGAGQLSATNADDYIRIAATLAADTTDRRRLRLGLREMMTSSPLCDAPGFARGLEATYRTLSRDQSGRTPSP